MLGRLLVGIVGFVLLAGSTALISCKTATTGETMRTTQMQWHGRIYRGEMGEKVGEQHSVANSTMTRLSDTSARATLTLRGGLGPGAYPWYVYSGQCGDAEPAIQGAADDYSPARPDEAGGFGNYTATFDARIDPDGQYHIRILKSADELGTVVACGNIRRGD